MQNTLWNNFLSQFFTCSRNHVYVVLCWKQCVVVILHWHEKKNGMTRAVLAIRNHSFDHEANTHAFHTFSTVKLFLQKQRAFVVSGLTALAVYKSSQVLYLSHVFKNKTTAWHLLCWCSAPLIFETCHLLDALMTACIPKSNGEDASTRRQRATDGLFPLPFPVGIGEYQVVGYASNALWWCWHSFMAQLTNRVSYVTGRPQNLGYLQTHTAVVYQVSISKFPAFSRFSQSAFAKFPEWHTELCFMSRQADTMSPDAVTLH